MLTGVGQGFEGTVLSVFSMFSGAATNGYKLLPLQGLAGRRALPFTAFAEGRVNKSRTTIEGMSGNWSGRGRARGMSEEQLRRGQYGGIWISGLFLASFGLVGAVLT